MNTSGDGRWKSCAPEPYRQQSLLASSYIAQLAIKDHVGRIRRLLAFIVNLHKRKPLLGPAVVWGLRFNYIVGFQINCRQSTKDNFKGWRGWRGHINDVITGRKGQQQFNYMCYFKTLLRRRTKTGLRRANHGSNLRKDDKPIQIILPNLKSLWNYDTIPITETNR